MVVRKAVAAAFCFGASDDTGATGADDAAPTVDERPILVSIPLVLDTLRMKTATSVRRYDLLPVVRCIMSTKPWLFQSGTRAGNTSLQCRTTKIGNIRADGRNRNTTLGEKLENARD